MSRTSASHPGTSGHSEPRHYCLQEKIPPTQIEEVDTEIPTTTLDLNPKPLDRGSIEDEDGAYADKRGMHPPPPNMRDRS